MFLEKKSPFLCIHREGDSSECGHYVRTKYLGDCVRQMLERGDLAIGRRWYKYTKAVYADSLVREGKLKVGSLLEYRNSERYKAGILDGEEGRKTTILKAKDEQWSSETLPGFFKDSGLLSIHGSGSGRVINSCFQHVVQARDHYTYCVSTMYDEALLAEFEADAIVEIFSPSQFAEALQESMDDHGLFAGSIDCEYHGRIQDYGFSSSTPLSVKDEKYASQAEVRIAWVPRRPDPVSAVFVQNLALRDFCRRIR